jgi:phage/plasmid-like protein (TIGR03299 family)
MAHNIATINGRVSMTYTGESPWHELGVQLPNTQSVEAAIQAANLDWTVATEALFLADGRQVENQVVIRTLDSAILGVVGSGYTPVQNSEAFAPFQAAIDSFGVTIETAGALGQGERVWMMAKLPDNNGHIVPGDKIEPYFLISTAHDGSQAVTARSTPIRVVCQNTLDAANRADRAALSIRHTISGPGRVSEIEQLVERMLSAHHNTIETFKSMAAREVTLDEVISYTEALWPVKLSEGQQVVANLLQSGQEKRTRGDDAREIVLDLLKSGQGAELAGQTAWGAYNAVTEYVDHVSVNTKAGKARVNGAQSAAFGAGADLKRRALDTALDMFLGSSRN